MSIPDLYGKRNKNAIPMPMEAKIPLPISTELHPAAQHAAAVYSDALMDLDRLREQCTRLSSDLEVERRANEQLREALQQERVSKEVYMRYSVEVRTYLVHMADLAVKANKLAMEKSAGSREDAFAQIENAVRDAVHMENERTTNGQSSEKG